MSNFKFSLKPINVPQVITDHRRIQTSIPSPGTKEILLELESYESRSMQGQMPIVWDRAEDFNIYDKNGNKWIDFTSTIFVVNVGHGNQIVRNAVKEVLEKPLLHTIKKIILLHQNLQNIFSLSIALRC